jgi:hypothetical protein
VVVEEEATEGENVARGELGSGREVEPNGWKFELPFSPEVCGKMGIGPAPMTVECGLGSEEGL